jgi:predicted nuclease with TOPRIM domain
VVILQRLYKKLKEKLPENLKLKTELCEKAEALKENTEWKETYTVTKRVIAKMPIAIDVLLRIPNV